MSVKTTSRIASCLLKMHHIQSSPSTCLRSIDRTRPDSSSAVIIGLDDAAQKKGHIYMSVIVNQETRQTIVLLNCRSGEELESYLSKNQQIQIVTRDGSITYADAIRRCLPHAIQISDKFHLVKNMLDTLTKEFAALLREPPGEKKSFSYPSVEECKAEMLKDLLKLGNQKHRETLRLFIEADSARREGKFFYQIGMLFNIHAEKVRRVLYKHTRRDYMIDEQKLLLKEIDALALEFSQGCCKVKQLAIKMAGKLSVSAIKRVSDGLRKKISEQQKNMKKYNSSITKKKKEARSPLKAIRHFILTQETKVEAVQKLKRNKVVKQTIVLAKEFRDILNGKSHNSLKDWIKRAVEAESRAIQSFTKYHCWALISS